jgi:alpha-D-xyloside xylohydrolase
LATSNVQTAQYGKATHVKQVWELPTSQTQLREWYTSQIELLLELGVDTLKTDFGERIPHESVVFHNGMDPHAGHSFCAHMYNSVVYKTLLSESEEDEMQLCSPEQQQQVVSGFPCTRVGDSESTRTPMAESRRGGLSLSLSGFGFLSHEIGSFMNEGIGREIPSPSLYKGGRAGP